MCPGAVVIVKVIGQDPLQVHFAENDHVVKALAPDQSDHSFAVRILPRRTGCNDDFVDSHVLDAVSEVVSVEAIPVSDQIPWSLFERKRLDHLLSCPSGRGIGRDIEVDHAATIVAKDDKTVENTEADRRYGEEVDPDQVGHVIVQKRCAKSAKRAGDDEPCILLRCCRPLRVPAASVRIESSARPMWDSPGTSGGSVPGRLVQSSVVLAWAALIFNANRAENPGDAIGSQSQASR